MCSGNPPLVHVGSPKGGPHWVFPIGQTSNTYSILDPFIYPNDSTIQGFNNTYNNLRLFTEIPGPLAGLYITAHSPVELVLTAPNNAQTGFDPLTKAQLNSIPASGYLEESLANDQNPALPATAPVKLLEVVDPASGKYILHLIGTGTGPYTLDIGAYDVNGSLRTKRFTGNITTGQTIEYDIIYSPAAGAQLVVTAIPIADAGQAQTVNAGATVTLDGSKSSDPTGLPLTYAWTQTAGPSVTLSNATTSKPTFTAPSVSTDTVLTFRLVVSNGTSTSTSSTVNVTVRNVNRAPVANAGPNQNVNEGTLVTLNGSGSSDPDGNPLTFRWTQTVGTSVTLSSTTVAQPTFVTPQVTADTTLTFQLVVNDGQVNSAPATVNITVRDVVIVTPPPASGGGGGGGGCAMNPKAEFDPTLLGIMGFMLASLGWKRTRRYWRKL